MLHVGEQVIVKKVVRYDYTAFNVPAKIVSIGGHDVVLAEVQLDRGGRYTTRLKNLIVVSLFEENNGQS